MAVSITAAAKNLLRKAVNGVTLVAGVDSVDNTKVSTSKSSNGALHQRPMPGPQTISRNRYLDVANATRVKAEWPSGANITELTVFATLATPNATGSEGYYLRLAVDAASDAIADGLLTVTSSSVDDAGWILIPIGQLVSIPLTEALSNGSLGGGRVDVRTEGGAALEVWIGAN